MIRRSSHSQIRSQFELQRHWQRVSRGFGEQRWGLRLCFLAPDGSCTKVARLDHLAGPLDHDQRADFIGVLDFVLEDRRQWWRLAVLITRPGPAVLVGGDVEWAASLYDAARRARVPCEVVYLAAGGKVVPLPPDDMPDLAVGY